MYFFFDQDITYTWQRDTSYIVLGFFILIVTNAILGNAGITPIGFHKTERSRNLFQLDYRDLLAVAGIKKAQDSNRSDGLTSTDESEREDSKESEMNKNPVRLLSPGQKTKQNPQSPNSAKYQIQ